MTYNVRNDFDPFPNTWKVRKTRIKQLIQQESPDLIGTQECSYRLVSDLQSLLPEYDWIGLGREGGSKNEYVAIFFKKDRFEVIAYDHFWLSDTPDVIGSTTWNHVVPRMATWVLFRDLKTNKQFYHINTHLDHESAEAREKGADLIVQKTSEFLEEVPIILTGDFNTGKDSAPYQRLTKDGVFVDTWYFADKQVNSQLGTFNNFKDHSGSKTRIDWILVQGSVSVNQVKIADDTYDGLFPSDHFPVIADINLG